MEKENPGIVAIVQARMGSTRLPGKVLMDIVGKPMLWHVINRLMKAELLDTIVIATTTKKEDRPVMKLARQMVSKATLGTMMTSWTGTFRQPSGSGRKSSSGLPLIVL